MEIRFGLTTTPEIGGKLNHWEEMKIDVDVGDSSYKFDSILIGLICVWDNARQFNGIEPKFVRSLKVFSFGVYLDHDFVKNEEGIMVLDTYITDCVCERIRQLQSYEKLFGMSHDRIVLSRIVERMLDSKNFKHETEQNNA